MMHRVCVILGAQARLARSGQRVCDQGPLGHIGIRFPIRDIENKTMTMVKRGVCASMQICVRTWVDMFVRPGIITRMRGVIWEENGDDFFALRVLGDDRCRAVKNNAIPQF